MDLQLHISAENFTAEAQKIVKHLEILEKKASGWIASKNRHEHETLKKEFRRIAPALSRLRLDCLCLSLSTDYQNQSAEMFQTLERLNRLLDLLQGFTFEEAGANPTVSSKTTEAIASLQKAICETRWQLGKIAYNPTLKQ